MQDLPIYYEPASAVGLCSSKAVQPVESTIAERNATHGDFAKNAATSQALKAIVTASPNVERLSPVQREALDMIMLKISRILTGNPNFADAWHDIGGYALLAERQITSCAELSK